MQVFRNESRGEEKDPMRQAIDHLCTHGQMRPGSALRTALLMATVSIACTDPGAPTSPSPTTGGGSPFATSYMVRATAAAHGAITPSGAVPVGAGNSQSFTIRPEPSYLVADVQVDGSSIGPVTGYLFTNVLTNHTITATFAPNPLVGVFDGTMRLATVSGGECVGADLSARAGSMDQGTVSIRVQDPAGPAPSPSAFQVTAFTRSSTTGLQCSYSGNAGSGFFSAGMESCDAEKELVFVCANSAIRILVPIGTTISGSITGNAASGNVATTYTVFDTPERRPVGALGVQQTFTAARQ